MRFINLSIYTFAPNAVPLLINNINEVEYGALITSVALNVVGDWTY